MSNRSIPIAIVHHANQYLITNGYDNRPGIEAIIGPPDASSGLRAVLYLHSLYNIPFHLHISGTFIEACAWFDPLFLEEIAEYKNTDQSSLLGLLTLKILCLCLTARTIAIKSWKSFVSLKLGLALIFLI